MVAVVAGNGLGLFNTSLNILGNGGVLGQAVLGQKKDLAYVNASTGNLILQSEGDELAGRDQGLLQLRTYNSLGQLNDGDGDGWRWAGEKSVVLTGTVNTQGSFVDRTDNDGHVTRFTWDSANSVYRTHEGGSADDTLRWDGTGQQWIFSDGSSQGTESYAGGGTAGVVARLQTQSDVAGNVVTYVYDNNGRLTTIVDDSKADGSGVGSGQKLVLNYGMVPGTTLTRLLSVQSFALTDANAQTPSLGTPTTDVTYGYDSQGRLTSVTTALSTDSTVPPTFYVTTYTYVGNTSLVSNITQGDGTSVSFTYDGSNRVKTLTDAGGTESFAYNTNSTDITYANGEVWTYRYDPTTQQLTEIDSPAAAVAADARPSTQFKYDGNGHVTSVTDALGRTLTYTYDAQGNQLTQVDSLGDTITRTFSATNQVLTETHYTGTSTTGVPAGALTTRYVYDSQSRLRFTISAEGRVTENRYGSSNTTLGLLTQTISYVGGRFDVTTLNSTTAPSESALQSWVAQQDQTQVEQTTYQYDARGGLSQVTEFADTDANGNGILDDAATVTKYVYNARGEVLQTLAMRGTNHSQGVILTSFTYDGLGRELTRVTAAGKQSTAYIDANRTIQITNAANLVETRSFDSAGRLISVTQTDATTGSMAPSRTTQYVYDAEGRLVMTQDPQNGRHFSFYDANGRLQYTVDATGAVIGRTYNDAGQLVNETQYSNQVSAAAMAGWVTAPPAALAVTKSILSVGGAGSDVIVDVNNDRIATYGYDNAGRQTTQSDGDGVVTTTSYDGDSRVTQIQVGTGTNSRTTHFFYDADGDQVGELDPLGYLTEKKYDGAGRLVQTIQYTTRSPLGSIDAPVWAGVTDQTAFGTQPFLYQVPAASDPDGDVVLTYSVVGTLPSWLHFDPVALTLSGTPPQGVTTYTVTLQVSDGRTPTPQVTNATLHIAVGNAPPAWTNQLPNVSVPAAQPLNVTLPAATDTAQSPLSYAINSNALPHGVSFNTATRQLTGTPTTPGTYVITVTVTDSATPPLSAQQTFILQVTNNGPAWTLPTDSTFLQALTTALNGQSYNVTLPAAIDPEGQALTYRIVSGPSWLSINSTPPVLSGVPPTTPDALGPQTVVLQVQDSFGETADLAFILNVEDSQVIASVVPVGASVASSTAQAPRVSAAVVKPADDPLTDVLASVRPSDHTSLNAYNFYDGEGRVVGEVDTRGFLTATSYDSDANTQQTIKYLAPVTVAANDTLATVEARGGATEVSIIQYDTVGRISTQTSADGSITSNQYDAAGRLSRQVVDSGATDARGTDTRYDAFGDITGTLGGVGDAVLASTPGETLDQAIATFGVRDDYDSLGRLIRTTDANNNATLYFYDAQGRLTQTVDALGDVTENTYTAFGQASALRRYYNTISLNGLTGGDGTALTALLKNTRDNRDQTSSTLYDRRGAVAQRTDGLGFITGNAYDIYGELVTRLQVIAKHTNVITQYSYDLDGQLISETDDAGGLNVNHQTAYDGYGRVIRTTDATGQVTTWTYNDNGRTVITSDPLKRNTTTTYDAFGRVLTVTDANSKSTTYSYDDVNRTVKVTTPEGISLVTVQNAFGEVTSVTSGETTTSAGETTSYTYDADGWVLTVTDPTSTATNPVVRKFQYDNGGRVSQVTDALGHITTYQYDALNRIVLRTVDPSGLNLQTQYEFDSFGLQLRVTEGSNLNSTTGSNALRVTEYHYDQDGQLSQVVVDPKGLALATSYSYDGRGDTLQVSQGTVSSPNQQVTIYKYDDLGRRIAQIEAPSSIFSGGSAVSRDRDLTTQYRYDANGRLTRTIDANGNSTWFVYDAAGELIQTVDALGDVTANTYDVDGRLIHTRHYLTPVSVATFGDAIGAVTPSPSTEDRQQYLVYDNDGRVRFTLNADGSAANGTNAFSIGENIYDSNGNVIESRQYDKEVPDSWISANDTSTSAGITQDELTTELKSLGYDGSAKSLANIHSTHFAYDLDNRLRFTVDPTGSVTENVYDSTGEVVERVGYAGQPALTAYDTATINNNVDRTNRLNQVTHFTYDSAGRQIYSAQVLAVDSSGNTTQQVVRKTDYDAVGRVVRTTAYAAPLLGTLPDYSQSSLDTAVKAIAGNALDRIDGLAYDTAGRLVYSVRVLSSTQQFVTQNVYDAMGHVVQTTAYQSPLTGTVDYTSATALATVLLAPTYAANAQNRTTKFVYDALGRLEFQVNADGSVRQVLYDALGQVTEQRQFNFLLDASAPVTESYLIGRVSARHVGDGVTRGQSFTYDALGRVLVTTDAQGATQVNGYDAFGNLRSFTDKNGATSSYTYDRHGRVLTQTAPPVALQLSGQSSASVQTLQTIFAYDAFGNLTSRQDGVNADPHGTSPDARTVTYTYDKLGRQRTSMQAGVQVSGDSSVPTATWMTLFTYDAFGNLTGSEQGVPAATGTGLDPTSVRTTTYLYDALGRQIQVTLPGVYDPTTGQVIASGGSASAFRRAVEISYDTFGDEVRRATRIAANTFQNEYTVYDTLGRATYQVDALGDVTNYGYDAFGDQTAVTRYSTQVATSASRLQWSSTDLANALKSDTASRTVSTTYDTMGRKLTVTSPTIGDYYGGLGLNPTDQLLSTFSGNANGTPTTTVAYDAFGDVTRESSAMDASRSRVTHQFYDVMGREVLTVDPMGYQTARTYDVSGNLTQVIEYAAVGPQVIDGAAIAPAPPAATPQDRITVNSYDALNHLVRVQRGGLTYSQLNPGAKTYVRVTNPSTTLTTVQTLTYDSLGDVRASTDVLGNVTTKDYNSLGQLIRQTDPVRAVSQAGSFNVSAGLNNETNTDPFLNSTQVTPVTTFTMDIFGDVTQTARNPGFNGGGVLMTSSTYDLVGHQISKTDANSHTTNYQYDYAGRVTQQTQLIFFTVTGDNSSAGSTLGSWGQSFGQTLERRFFYDALGRQTDVLDVYTDPNKTVQQQTGNRQIYNAFGEVVRQLKEYGDVGLTPVQLTPGDLAQYTVTAYSYDNDGNIMEKDGADGKTVYFYNLAGQVTRQEQRGGFSAGDPNVRVTELEYDTDGRGIVAIAPGFMRAAGGTFKINPVTLEQYDRWGNVTSRSGRDAYLDEFGGLKDDDPTAATTYQYDADNRLIATQQAAQTAYNHKGGFYQVEVIHETHYDIAGRLVQEDDITANTGSASTDGKLLRLHQKGYDSVGQLISDTDFPDVTQAGNVTQYVYDGNGNQIATRNAAGTVFVQTFDGNGNLLSRGVLRSAPTFGTVDGAAYISGKTSPASIYLTTLNLYLYDEANRRIGERDTTSANAFGAVDNMVTNWSYTLYDERGLVTETGAGVSLDVTKYQYDALGNKIFQADLVDGDSAHGGVSQNWNYALLNDGTYRIGQLKSFAQGTRTSQFTYDSFGELQLESDHDTAVFMAPGQPDNTRTYTYYENGRLEEISDQLFVGDGGGEDGSPSFDATPKDLQYQYDAAGDVTFQRSAATDNLTGTGDVQRIQTATFSYDQLGRLIESDYPVGAAQNTQVDVLSSLKYSYDELGNRVESKATYTAFGQATNTLDVWDDFDNDGRVTVDFGEQIGALILTGQGGTAVTYNVLGQRATTFNFLETSHVGGPTSPTVEVDLEKFYTYNDLGYLQKIDQQVDTFGATEKQSGLNLFLSQQTDLAGNVVESQQFQEGFSTFGPLPPLVSTTTSTYGRQGLQKLQYTNATDATQNYTTTYSYDISGNIQSYTYAANGNSEKYDYVYEYEFTGRVVGEINGTSTKASVVSGHTTNLYDARGNLIDQMVADSFDQSDSKSVANRTSHEDEFIDDGLGNILTERDNQNVGRTGPGTPGKKDFYYHDGSEITQVGSGTLDPGGGVHIDTGFTPVSAPVASSAPASYTVNPTDTLGGIAQTVYGNASLWYLIADANGLDFGPNQSLFAEAGKIYQIPKVNTSSNNTNTTTPSKTAVIVAGGPPAPWLPPPPAQQCSGVGAAIANVVVSAVDAVVEKVGGAALSTILPEPIANAISGAAGNALGQGLGDLLGVHHGFSFEDVGEAAVKNVLDDSLGDEADTAAGQLTTGIGDEVIDSAGATLAGDQQKLDALPDGLSLLTQTGFAALSAQTGLTDFLNVGNFNFSKPLTQFANSAIGAEGWAYKPESQWDWSIVVGAANSVTDSLADGLSKGLQPTPPTEVNDPVGPINPTDLSGSNSALAVQDAADSPSAPSQAVLVSQSQTVLSPSHESITEQATIVDDLDNGTSANANSAAGADAAPAENVSRLSDQPDPSDPTAPRDPLSDKFGLQQPLQSTPQGETDNPTTPEEAADLARIAERAAGLAPTPAPPDGAPVAGGAAEQSSPSSIDLRLRATDPLIDSLLSPRTPADTAAEAQVGSPPQRGPELSPQSPAEAAADAETASAIRDLRQQFGPISNPADQTESLEWLRNLQQERFGVQVTVPAAIPEPPVPGLLKSIVRSPVANNVVGEVGGAINTVLSFIAVEQAIDQAVNTPAGDPKRDLIRLNAGISAGLLLVPPAVDRFATAFFPGADGLALATRTNVGLLAFQLVLDEESNPDEYAKYVADQLRTVGLNPRASLPQFGASYLVGSFFALQHGLDRNIRGTINAVGSFAQQVSHIDDNLHNLDNQILQGAIQADIDDRRLEMVP